MRRITGWERSLTDYLRSAAERPFEWGINDCCLFAADCVKLCLGIDFAEPFRGQYDTAEGATHALATIGSGDLLQTIDHIMNSAGIKEKPKSFSQRGDLVYMVVGDLPCLGVVDLTARNVIGMGPQGLIQVPLAQALKVWRIG